MDPQASSATVGGRRGGGINSPTSSSGSTTSGTASSSNSSKSRKGRPSVVHYLPEDEAITIRYPNLYDEDGDGPNSPLGSPEFPTPLVHFPPPPGYPPPAGARSRQKHHHIQTHQGRASAHNPVIINGTNPCLNNHDAMLLPENTMSFRASSAGKNHHRMMTTGRVAQNSSFFVAGNNINSKTLNSAGEKSKKSPTTTAKGSKSIIVRNPANNNSNNNNNNDITSMMMLHQSGHHHHHLHLNNNNNGAAQTNNNSNGRNCSETNGNSSSMVLMNGGAASSRNNGIINAATIASTPINEGAVAQSDARPENKSQNDTMTETTKGNCNNNEPQSKWSRNHIASTMERYDPSTSSSSMSSYNSSAGHQQQHHHPGGGQCCHQDYSYAYYEPGAAMRHSNVPGTSSEPGPSRPPPPNSIRALLSKGRNSQLNSPNATGNTRHLFSNRYGTHENIYEEVGSDERLQMLMMASGQSMISLDQSMIEEEFRRVQHRHHRVLGELNLSVEALIMPSTPQNDSPTGEANEGIKPREEDSNCASTSQRRSNDFPLKTIPHSEDLFSPVCGSSNFPDSSAGECNSGNNNGDLDSGFSGSSSGASYVGSLRYHRTNPPCCPPNCSGIPEGGNHLGSYTNRFRSSNRSQEDPGIPFSTRSSSSYSSTRSQHRPSHSLSNNYPNFGTVHVPALYQRSAEDPGPRSAHLLHHMNSVCSNSASDSNSGDIKTTKGSFWSKKGWKFPGFSSTPSVNKAGCINF